MAKIRCENLVLKSKLNDLLSTIVNAGKELESLKTDLNNVKSEHKKSKRVQIILKILLICLEESHYQLLIDSYYLVIKLFQHEMRFIITKEKVVLLKMTRYQLLMNVMR